MKILKKGTAPEQTPWWIGNVVTCENCKSQIELQELDCIDQITIEENYVQFICPLPGCESKIKHYYQSGNQPSIRSKN